MEMYPQRDSVNKHNVQSYTQCELNSSFRSDPGETRGSYRHQQTVQDHSNNKRNQGNGMKYNDSQCNTKVCGRFHSDSHFVTYYNNDDFTNTHCKDYKRSNSDITARSDRWTDLDYDSDIRYNSGVNINGRSERSSVKNSHGDTNRHKSAHHEFTRSVSDPPVKSNGQISSFTTVPSKQSGKLKKDASKRTRTRASSKSRSKEQTGKGVIDRTSGGMHSQSIPSTSKAIGLDQLAANYTKSAVPERRKKSSNSSSNSSTKRTTSNINQMYIDLELNKVAGKGLGDSRNGLAIPQQYQDGPNGSCVSCRSARRRLLVLTAIVLTTLLLAGIIAVIAAIFSQNGDPGHIRESIPGYRMLKAHVEMRLVNEEYRPSMGDNASMAFAEVSAKLCREVDYAFLTSSINETYFGCSLITVRPGSIRIYYISPFLDTNYSSNTTVLRNIILKTTSVSGALPGLGDGVRTSVGTSVNGSPQVGGVRMLGEYLLDTNNIHIRIERYTTGALPARPILPQTDSAPPSPISVGISISTTATTAVAAATTSADGSIAGLHHPEIGSMQKTTSSKRIRAQTIVQPNSTGVMGITEARTSNVAFINNPERHVTSTSFRPHQASSTNRPTRSVIPSSTTTTVFLRPSWLSTESTTVTDTVTLKYAEYSVTDNLTWWGDESTTTSNTETSTTEPVPVVTIMGDNVRLMKEKASVVCTVARTHSLHHVTLSHIDPYGDNSTIKTLYETDFTEAHGVFKTDIIGHKCLFIKIELEQILIGMNFTYVKCEDTGQYMCSVAMDTAQESAVGYLHGYAPSSTPHLSLPIEIVEDKEITEPIVCSANVGYPKGRLKWEIKPKGELQCLRGFGGFLPFPGDDSATEACDTRVTRSLIYTPTRDGNGTLLRCSVVSNNGQVSTSRPSSTVKEIRILPASICNDVPMNKSIRHPFTCTRYISCHGDTYDVKECSDQMCFDEESGRCGQSSLAMKTVNAYLNEGVTSLQCRLMHLGHWHNISIFKKLPSGELGLIMKATSGKDGVTMYNSSMIGRVIGQIDASRRYEVDINMWVYVLTCDDAGEYICHAETPSMNVNVTASIDLKVKPDAPNLHVPNDVIEGLPMRQNISCVANVGYPHGRLLLKMRLANETAFRPVPYNMTTIAAPGNCSKSVRASFTFLPTLGHEGMEVQCEVQNNYTLPPGHHLAVKQIVHVVPGNFCLENPDKSPQVHPYDCHQYVQCSGGTTYVQQCGSPLCFNPITRQCDTEPDAQYPFDPKRPCRPNKNGVFYPHPILCNKYIWCVQGQAVIQHCPMGTLYIDGGQCTFEPQRSRCYTNIA